MSKPVVEIMSTRILTGDGVEAATVDRVGVGGGTQVVMVDGTPETRTHPLSTIFHVRLLSPDRLLPDDLREAATYEEAVALGTDYAVRLSGAAQKLAAISAELKGS